MIVVAKEDVLKALKKFRRLAKQDILLSQRTAEPEFWCQQAEGRRNTYGKLMQLIEDDGVDYAYNYAVKQYANLPFIYATETDNAELIGQGQAFEMFYAILGVQPPAKKQCIPPRIPISDSGGDIAANAP